MPGPTGTGFFARADLLDTTVGQNKKDDPGLVAQQGYDALMASKPKIVAGSRKTKRHGLATRILPDRARASAQRR